MPQISTGWWIDRFGIHPLNTEEIDDGKWYRTAAPLFSPDRGSRWIQTGRLQIADPRWAGSQNRTQKDPNLEVLNLDLCPNHAKSSNRPSEVLGFLFNFGQWRSLRFCLDSCCKWQVAAFLSTAEHQLLVVWNIFHALPPQLGSLVPHWLVCLATAVRLLV